VSDGSILTVGEGLFEEAILSADRGQDRLTGRREDRERFVAAKLDHRAAVFLHRLARDPGEPGGELGGGFVPAFLCEQRVAADVCDEERSDARRLARGPVSRSIPHPVPQARCPEYGLAGGRTPEETP